MIYYWKLVRLLGLLSILLHHFIELLLVFCYPRRSLRRLQVSLNVLWTCWDRLIFHVRWFFREYAVLPRVKAGVFARHWHCHVLYILCIEPDSLVALIPGEHPAMSFVWADHYIGWVLYFLKVQLSRAFLVGHFHTHRRVDSHRGRGTYEIAIVSRDHHPGVGWAVVWHLVDLSVKILKLLFEIVKEVLAESLLYEATVRIDPLFVSGRYVPRILYCPVNFVLVLGTIYRRLNGLLLIKLNSLVSDI